MRIPFYIKSKYVRNFICAPVLIIKQTRCTNFWNLFFKLNLYMFRTVSLSIISSFSLYAQQWYMSYRLADSLWTNQYAIYHCCMHSEKTADDGQRNCPKHVQFHSKNKFEKLVHLVGFVIRIYHDARSRCTVPWTSISSIYFKFYVLFWDLFFSTADNNLIYREFYFQCNYLARSCTVY